MKFDYLQARQAAALLRQYGEHLGFDMSDDLERLATVHLQYVTPGDFAAVMRQQRFRPVGGLGDFLEALKGETALKAVSKPCIGFLQ